MKSFLKNLTLRALLFEAKAALAIHQPTIITITGTVGKTSTKEAIYAALRAPGHSVRKSEKSFNSEIGIPLAILGLPTAWNNPFGWMLVFLRGAFSALSFSFPKMLVLEAGIDRPGDMKELVSWLIPDIAVITKFSKTPVHVEYFDSPEAVSKEKSLLAKAVPPGGTVVLNADDADVLAIQTNLGRKTVTSGFGEQADIRASHEQLLYASNGEPEGMTFKVNIGSSSVPVRLRGGIGRQQVYPVLAAFAVGGLFNIDLVSIAQAIEEMPLIAGRMRLLKGKNGSLLIDDSYNASPVAVEAALDSLRLLEVRGRKIAALADMKELGKYSEEAHRAVGKQAAGVADVLVCVGEAAVYIAEEAKKTGMAASDVHTFANSDEASHFLSKIISEGDTVLVKGSQSMRMEKVSRVLLAELENAERVLPRQEKEWGRR